MQMMGRSLALILVVGPALAVAVDKGDKPKSAAPDALAIVGDVTITQSQFDAKAAARLIALRQQEYDVKRQVLDEMIGEILLNKAAAGRGVSLDELLAQEVEAKLVPPADADAKQVYEQVKGRYPNRTEADLTVEIKASQRQQRYQMRRQEFVRELRDKASVKVMLDPPRVAVDAGNGPAKGPQTAPVTLVEFSDFQCPYCGRVFPTLKRIEDRYGDKLRFVFRQFPLAMHPLAPKAAEAAACAQEQGKFWEFHDRLFTNQGKLQIADLKQHAVELGFDADKFNQCLDAGKHEADWKKDLEDGARYGVSGTPAIFVNGRMVSGARPYEEFTRVIDEELQRAGVAIPPPPPMPVVEAAKPAPSDK